ncbi:mucoidy inhibitor MuiA family protein [Microvirga sp. M2]|uniref:mucoidy inhibitor MuiA family protein n=1 Tax=Microvirga sp. M2 TaxID=3073270 RepID=UPI0039C0EA2B
MRSFFASILIAIPSFAVAQVELTSRIESVVVFPDAAVVTRIMPIELQGGSSTMVLRGLPSSMDPASLRIEGEGGSAFTIGTVDVRATPGDAMPSVNAELESRLKTLQDELDSLQGRIAAGEGKKAAIERYAQASPEKLSSDAKPLDIAQWPNAWKMIGDGLAQANEDLRTLRSNAVDIEKQINALEQAQAEAIRPGAPKRDVVIALESSTRMTGRLRVSYRVSGASWSALYDADLKTGPQDGQPNLVLTRRAHVSQRTGENWENVQLSVSTVRVNRGTAAPDLPPLKASFVEPEADIRQRAPAGRVVPPAPKNAGFRRTLEEESPALFDNAAEPEPERKEQRAEEQKAVADIGAFQASFQVPGRVTVSQDGAAKSFVLSQRSIAPSLLVKTTPVLDTAAYLEASFTNEDEAVIIPGEVSLQRDGAYIGRSHVKLVATGETVNLGFGTDDRVKVTRVPLRRNKSEASWLGKTQSDVSEFRTTVKNLHAYPMRITIMDRVPFSENQNLVVEMLRESTPPTESQVQDKRGVMAWSGEYAPGEQKEVRFGYLLKWPQDKQVTFETQPLAQP